MIVILVVSLVVNVVGLSWLAYASVTLRSVSRQLADMERELVLLVPVVRRTDRMLRTWAETWVDERVRVELQRAIDEGDR